MLEGEALMRRALECVRNRHRDYEGDDRRCSWCLKPWPCVDFKDATEALGETLPEGDERG